MYYQTYQTQDDARHWLANHAGQIQVVASAQGWLAGLVPFSQTQWSGLTNYADGVYKVAFRSQL